MSDRDTVKAVIAEVGAILAADEDLLTVLADEGEDVGEFRYHYVWAPPNCEFPYLTVDGTVRPLGTEDGYQEVDLRLDLWDCDPSADRMLAMRKRVLALLNRRVVECDEFYGRLFFTGDFDLSQPEAEVWRRSTSWTMRLYPSAEVVDMKARG